MSKDQNTNHKTNNLTKSCQDDETPEKHMQVFLGGIPSLITQGKVLKYIFN